MEESEAKKYDIVLFIGNGFDIACGYKTSYKWFIESDYFKNILEDNDLCKFIHNKYNEDARWFDIEMGLYYYSKDLDKKYGANDDKQAKKFESDYIRLRAALQEYIISINSWQSNRTIDINNFLNKIFYVPHEYPKKYSVYIINFNYTQIFWTECNVYNDSFDLNKVHGNLQFCLPQKENKIVFGIDEYYQGVNPLHSFLYKSFDSNQNIKGIKEVIDNSPKYIFYGCSLGDTDRWYYGLVFNQENKNYDLYCYTDKDVSNYKQSIGKISKSFNNFKAENNVTFYDSIKLSKL